MHSPVIYLLAAIGVAVSLALPVTAEYLDNDEYSIFIREAFADYGIDYDELAFLAARADTWAETALDVAKTVVPYAANHVNFPNAPKSTFSLGLAGKILEKVPTPKQIAATRAREQSPSGGTIIRQNMQKEAQEKAAQQAATQGANQAKLDALNTASKENANKMRTGAGTSQESPAHPVQDALKTKPPVPAKPSALSNLKFSQPSSSGTGSSSGKPALQRSNSMPVQSNKEPTLGLQRSNTAPARSPPAPPPKPKALQGKKVKRDLLRRRMMELLIEENDLWWL